MKIRIFVLGFGLFLLIFFSSRLPAQEVPAGSILEIRLRTPVSSYSAKRGDKLHAILSAPVQQEGRDLLPAGTDVYGSVVTAKRVGVGLIRECARLRLQFDSLRLPGSTPVAITSQVVEVENAREKVLAEGTIVGTRATNSYGHRMTGMVTGVASIDPLLTLFAFAGSSSILRFAEAEITYPVGTELLLKLSQPVRVDGITSDPPSPIAANDFERQSLGVYISELPFRTYTKHRNIPSDLTNLVFIGTAPQLIQAFALGGWRQAAALDSVTKYQTLRAMAENRGYPEAPVSVLLLDGKPPALVFEKTLNTIDKRHHMRVWQITEGWNGQTVWIAAATHDIGIAISKKRPIHKIDPEIDNERTKIVNDLLFTGCVDGIEMVERARVPRVTYNAAVDRLVTDGQMAVVRLKDCAGPGENSTPQRRPAASTGDFLTRGIRQFDLTMRNSLLRDNVGWQAYRGGRLAWKAAHHHSSSPAAAPGADSAGTSLPSPEAVSEATSEPRLTVGETFFGGVTQESSLPHLPELALSLNGGKFVGMGLGSVYLGWVNPDTGDVDLFEYPLRIDSGALLGGSITLHPSRFLSHQLFYGTAQTNLVTGVDPNRQVDRLSIRTTGYQIEANLAPGRWPVRPFVTGGGSLSTYRFKNTRLSKKNGVFRFGLKGVGTVVNAYKSAGVAPLDGGKIFQLSLTYGGGMKFRLSRLIEFRAEYRGTYAKDPDFFNKESVNLTAQGLGSAQDMGARRHGSYIIGLSLTP